MFFKRCFFKQCFYAEEVNVRAYQGFNYTFGKTALTCPHVFLKALSNDTKTISVWLCSGWFSHQKRQPRLKQQIFNGEVALEKCHLPALVTKPKMIFFI